MLAIFLDKKGAKRPLRNFQNEIIPYDLERRVFEHSYGLKIDGAS